MSSREDQKILRNTAPADVSPRAAWAFLSGIPPRGTNTVTLLILQHAANPEYPGDWVAYDQLNWLQPTFPSRGTAFALEKDKPLVLRYRLVVAEGVCDPARARAAWVEYNDNHEKKGDPL
jgi:hypothetical protein